MLAVSTWLATVKGLSTWPYKSHETKRKWGLATGWEKKKEQKKSLAGRRFKGRAKFGVCFGHFEKEESVKSCMRRGVLIFYFESLKGSLGLIIGGRDPRASFFLFLSFKISCFPIFVTMI